LSRKRTEQPTRRRRPQKVKGGLKGFADARKTNVDLLKDIRTHVVAQEAQHGNDHREKSKIHVSELTKDDPCARRLYFKISGEPESDPVPPVFAQLISIWAAGSAEHVKWQRWLREMGDLWGSWFCMQCEFKWPDTSPDHCPVCSGTLLRYDEVELEDAGYPLVGHADGAVPRLNALVEIKSFATGSVRVEQPALVAQHTYKHDGKTLIDHDGLWKSIKRPLRSHLLQGLLYLWMCKRKGLVYDRIIFIYENKTTQATKAFEIRLSDRFLAEPLALLEEVRRAEVAGVAPPRPRNFALDAKPCKDCPFRSTCWGETSDAGSESTAVQAGGSRSGGEEAGGAAEVRPARTSSRSAAGGPRRHHRPGRPGPDRDDDAPDQVGRASRRAVGDGRGGRAVGRGSDGQGTSPRFARRNREGRDPD
jgi:hypothetical protein